jgi:hypothetical protein
VNANVQVLIVEEQPNFRLFTGGFTFVRFLLTEVVRRLSLRPTWLVESAVDLDWLCNMQYSSAPRAVFLCENS